MKTIKREFIHFKQKIENNKLITVGKVGTIDASLFQEHPSPKTDIQDTYGLVINNEALSTSSYYSYHFKNIRSEIGFNLSMPILSPSKIKYLSDILNYFSKIEKRIFDNKKGDTPTDLFVFDKSLDNNLLKLYIDPYHDFLRKFKRALREEILYISDEIKLLKNQGSKAKGVEQKTYRPDIEWNANLNDLVELVRALKLSGAIDNRSKNLSFDQAYKVFGDLFGIELKNPEDQMSQKSLNKDKEFFCEKLNRFAQEDLKEFQKRAYK